MRLWVTGSPDAPASCQTRSCWCMPTPGVGVPTRSVVDLPEAAA